MGCCNLIFFLSLLSDNIYIYIFTKPENEFPLTFDRPSYVFEVSELRPGKEPTGHRSQGSCGLLHPHAWSTEQKPPSAQGVPSGVVQGNSQLIRVYCISHFF